MTGVTACLLLSVLNVDIIPRAGCRYFETMRQKARRKGLRKENTRAVNPESGIIKPQNQSQKAIYLLTSSNVRKK